MMHSFQTYLSTLNIFTTKLNKYVSHYFLQCSVTVASCTIRTFFKPTLCHTTVLSTLATAIINQTIVLPAILLFFVVWVYGIAKR